MTYRRKKKKKRESEVQYYFRKEWLRESYNFHTIYFFVCLYALDVCFYPT